MYLLDQGLIDVVVSLKDTENLIPLILKGVRQMEGQSLRGD